jgi:hypothetical protein
MAKIYEPFELGICKLIRLVTRKLVGRSGSRIPPVGTRNPTGSEAHSASSLVGNGGSAPGIKRPRREVDHCTPSSDEVKNEWRYTSTSLACVGNTLPVLYPCIVCQML